MMIVMGFRKRRSGLGLRPVNSLKHVVDSSATLAAATTLTIDVITTVDNPAAAQTTQCHIGSTVNAIFLNVEVAGNELDAGAIPNFYMAVFKNPSGLMNPPDPSSIGNDLNRRFIIHQEMVMLQNAVGGNSRKVFQGVIKLPPRIKRNGVADKLSVILRSPQLDVAVCIQCIYKEFY